MYELLSNCSVIERPARALPTLSPLITASILAVLLLLSKSIDMQHTHTEMNETVKKTQTVPKVHNTRATVRLFLSAQVNVSTSILGKIK